MPQLTIQMVTWNSAKHLVWSLPVLAKISPRQATIRIIDNASSDDSATIAKSRLPQAEIIQLPSNQGFAGAHNIGLSKCDTPFVLTLDPDVELNPEAIFKLLENFNDEKLAALQGKLMRKDISASGEAVIDSAGIVLSRAFNGLERGANEIDAGQYDKPAALTAVTGACGLYRLAALKQVAHNLTEFFDQDFFAYKEDVDLGWRLVKAGFKVSYQPITVGCHARTLGRCGWLNWGLNPKQILERVRSRRTYYSVRNWIWMITKNSNLGEELRHEIFIDARLLVFLLLSFIYWPLFSVWGDVARGLPTMRQKRDRQLAPKPEVRPQTV